MAPTKALRPAPEGMAGHSRSLSALGPRDGSLIFDLKKTTASVACTSCKTKKIRCSAERPICKACRERDRTCVYEVEEGVTRSEGLRRKTQQLQDEVDSVKTLFAFLQTGDETDVRSLCSQIRSGGSIDDALTFVQKSTPALNLSRMQVQTAPDEEPGLQWSQKLHQEAAYMDHVILSAAASELSMEAIREGIGFYFRYLGIMFPVLDRGEADEMLNTYESLPALVTDEQVEIKKLLLGELLALCAVGFQYERVNIVGGQASICTPYYQKARLFLDFVVEKDQLRAMRMCCCLGMYNIVAKSTPAITYTDFGLQLGMNNQIDQSIKPPKFSDMQWSSYKKVFRALITLRSWVTATLGHVPCPDIMKLLYEARDDVEKQRHLMMPENVVEAIQRNMAAITILKAEILRTTVSFPRLTPLALLNMKTHVANWHSSLPSCLQLENLVMEPEISTDQRTVTFYMHLFYMSALMLRARAVLAEDDSDPEFYAHAETRDAVIEGLQAARASGRLLSIIYDEKAIIRNCWLIMYQSYLTFLALKFAMIKGFLAHGLREPQKSDSQLASRCLDILKLCASKDRIGLTFHTRLLSIQVNLDTCLPVELAESGTSLEQANETNASSEDWLFQQHRQSSADRLSLILKDIVRMFCYPLVSSGKDRLLSYPKIAEAFGTADINFAHHLASPFNMPEEGVPIDLFPPPSTMSQTYDDMNGTFVNGSRPHDWADSAWDGAGQGGREDGD